ncbi:transcriptional regulator, DeoR family protein [Carnobacterium sp. AT7]|uniref:DeoR/GlpR family DNA-binding transcription regulator n=2 Tax=Carnobacteriaceae TaxID=186828 RepID=UPI00015F2709|nr:MULTISPECIES: DeoR/GlpR family DNA-binding transcription regulator [Carnobacterium]EDP67491.1 transcriptional regulator, DeoR family protein [Carnobacterium sp. AT7]
MITEERYNFIIEKLNHYGVIKSQELMLEMNCSESTIRRDLALLEEQGKLVRVHGGAKRVYTVEKEQTLTEKSIKNVQNKKNIAKLAASFVEDGDTIFLDAGSTTFFMVPFLKEKSIHIVTNAVQHALLLSEQNNDVLLIGGKLKNTTQAIIGTTSIEQLSRYRFNKAFLGMNGIDKDYGFTTPDPEEAAVKQQAFKNSSKAYVLADETKFNKVTFVKVCNIDDALIITDHLTAKKYGSYYTTTTILEAKS